MKIKFKKLNEDAILPSYAKEGDAGLDLTATTDGVLVTSKDGEASYYYVEYRTSLAAEIPEGYVGLLFPRSSISKTIMLLANHVGVVDSGYRGEIKLRFKVDGGLVWKPQFTGDVAKYKKGDKIGQLMILPIPSIEPEFTDELSNTERGSGGFGSSGA